MLGEDRTKRALLGALIMDASPLLELRALNVRFGRVEVLRNFSLSVRRGEFVWLVGPTGSGKSTILRILAGLQQPASGEVVIAGDHVERFSAAQKRWLRRSMGLMMQDCFLLEDRTVESNVMLPALVANEGYAEARRRAYLALEKCGISELGKLKPAALSAGQRQLAMLARAVVNRPVVILADDPLAQLDEENAAVLLRLLLAFASAGVTVMAASHRRPPAASAHFRVVALEPSV